MANALDRCDNCGKRCGSGELFRHAQKFICPDCLEKETYFGNCCPSCGGTIDQASEEAQLLMVPRGATLGQEQGVNVPVIICPHCHVLHLDGYQYANARRLQLTGSAVVEYTLGVLDISDGVGRSVN